ncbi:MAG TPA: hypothetical protein ENG51_02755 [Deltaproteobacteria bacterium]|nr:hypothetical protein [Deltaproteobacteria bacterium]
MARGTLVMMIILSFFVKPCPAAWFDDFANNMSVSRPAHLANQERGYYSMGGVSYRTPTKVVPVLTVTPPTFQIGCGGIDGFWGGFSYLSADYLVQMFQNIMQAAPAFAFKMALKVLCEQCDSAMSSLEQIAQTINSTVLDECKTAQMAGSWAGEKLANLIGRKTSLGEIDNFLDGIKNHVQNFSTELQNFYNQHLCANPGSPECQKKKDLDWPNGSLWLKILNDGKVPGLTRSETDVLRALVGDIRFIAPTNEQAGAVMYIEPCTDSAIGTTIDAMIDTDPNKAVMPAKTWNDGTNSPSEQCTTVSIQSLQFGVRARTLLATLSDKVLNNRNQPLSAAEQQFLSEQLFPLYKILNVYSLYPGWAVNGQIPEMDTLVTLSSISSAYYAMRAIVAEARRTVAEYSGKIENEAQSINGIPDEWWRDARDRFNTRCRELLSVLSTHYRNEVGKLIEAMQVIVKYRKLEQDLKTALASTSMLSAYNF